VGVAIVLTFLFGPFGLFYSMIVGGVLMLEVEVLLFVLGFVTLGPGFIQQSKECAPRVNW
jgi:hypothetical protein